MHISPGQLGAAQPWQRGSEIIAERSILLFHLLFFQIWKHLLSQEEKITSQQHAHSCSVALRRCPSAQLSWKHGAAQCSSSHQMHKPIPHSKAQWNKQTLEELHWEEDPNPSVVLSSDRVMSCWMEMRCGSRALFLPAVGKCQEKELCPLFRCFHSQFCSRHSEGKMRKISVGTESGLDQPVGCFMEIWS